LNNLPTLKSRRRGLRASLTPAEAFLWTHLQSSQLDGFKFRRQHSIGPYVIDFYCPAGHLAIELDGAAHDSADAERHDRTRDEFLQSLGIRVVRYENRDIIVNSDAVLLDIRKHLH